MNEHSDVIGDERGVAGPGPVSRQRWRTILVLALVVAGGAFLTGQSATAVRTRRSLAAGLGRLRGGAEHAGLRTGPVGTWVYANKQLLRIAAVTLAALARPPTQT